MEELPADLTMDILSRLPVKTIVYCNLVCKKWQNLVFDSLFINLHLSKSLPTSLIIHRIDHRDVSEDPGILKWVEIEDKVDHHHLRPTMSLDLNLAPVLQKSLIHQRGSVNGLIFLRQICSKLDHNTYICNPITREYMILPRPRYYNQGFVIIFYGFGVSSVTGEYKVVRIFQGDILSDDKKLSQPSVLEAEVYTLGTGQWRSLGCVPYWLHGFYGPFLNNHCHWIVCDNKDEKICSFDLDKETFQLFPSSPSKAIRGSGFYNQSLAVVKGCLCKLEAYDSHFTIWVMKEYGIKKSWHKEVVIKKQGINSREPMYLIEGLKDGSILALSHNEKLVAYHPESNTIEDTKILDRCLSAMTYRPSFIKLKNYESERVHMF